MKARIYLMAILGVAVSGSALAQWDSDRERLAEQAVQVGHTVEGMVNGRPATAVPYPVSQRGCTGVGIIQPGQRAFRPASSKPPSKSPEASPATRLSRSGASPITAAMAALSARCRARPAPGSRAST